MNTNNGVIFITAMGSYSFQSLTSKLVRGVDPSLIN